MARNSIRTPDGEKHELRLPSENLAVVVEAEYIDPFRDYLLSNWLDSGKTALANSQEIRVKQYLDRLAELLLTDPGSYVILTGRVQRRITRRELPLRESTMVAPPPSHKRVYKRRATEVSRSERFQHLAQTYPGLQIAWHEVDTDGRFQADGVVHRVSHPGYQPTKLAGDVYYAMDRVGVAHWQQGILYLTQWLDVIPIDMVRRFAAPGKGGCA